MNLPGSSPIKRVIRLLVLIVTSELATLVLAQTLPPNVSASPRLPHPFSLSDEQWDALFIAETPSGRRLAAAQIPGLVLHAEWPLQSIPARAHWHLKIGVFLLKVRPDGTVSNVETLQSIGHP